MKTLNPQTIKARSVHALESAREDLRANILVRRAALQLSQSDLAKQSGVSRPVISKIETAAGDFQISALAKVAAVLGCPVAELLAPGRTGPVSDVEIAQRFNTPRSQFLDGKLLWAAIEEVDSAKERADKSVDGTLPSRGRKRVGKASNGRAKENR